MSFPKVTIIGAGNVGATAAQLILQKNLAHVVLLDVVEGMPQGKALDLMHLRSIECFEPLVTGSNDYEAACESDVVVITAGIARKPGMTREDLLETNAKILSSCIDQAVEVAPNAIYLIVTNPLDHMAYIGYKRLHEHGVPAERVIGMGGVLDSARFAYEIYRKTNANINDVEATVIGAHGQGMVPLSRFSYVNGTPVAELLEAADIIEIEERTVGGGAEVVSLLKTGSAFYAPGASIAAMVEAIVHDTGAVMSSCVLLNGEYGHEGIYMCVPARLGAAGVLGVEVLDLNTSEQAALDKAAAQIRAGLADFGVL